MVARRLDLLAAMGAIGAMGAVNDPPMLAQARPRVDPVLSGFGVILPGGTAREHATLAERSGWDAVFVWEAAYGVDAWTLLGAMAAVTERVRLGTLLTPLPWRRPWKVASQVVTLDQLSRGRAILAVGVGAVTTDLPMTGEVMGLRERAELMDEGIDLIRALWSGATKFYGTHYRVESDRDDLAQVGRPVQNPIPIWTVAVWPRPKSMRRVLKCDGIIPQYQGDEATPSDAAAVRQWLEEHGARPGTDIISEGETPGDDPDAARELVRPWREAGCTWWLETRWEMPHHSPQRMREISDRIAAGPPVLD